MKVQREEPEQIEAPVQDVPVRSVQAFGIREGDRITAGVTHEIGINGDKAWVKFEGSTYVGEHETGDQAAERIIDFVNTKVHETIKSTVESTLERIN